MNMIEASIDARQAQQSLRELLGIDFSDEQIAAITAPLQPNVVIAGAGSGKTTVMAARVVWFVASGQVRPDQVLGLTFTKKAAAELSQRVAAALQLADVVDRDGPEDPGEQLILTYDAFAGRLVKDHGLRIGIESDSQLITGATRFRLASKAVAEATGPFEYLARLRPASLTERVLALDEQLSQHMISEAELIDWTQAYLAELEQAPTYRGKPYAQVKNAAAVAGERLELVSLVKQYRLEKAKAGVVEFHDQMAVAATLAEQVAEVGAILRNQFRVVLLDEYQDTSAAQARLLRALFGAGVDVTGRGHPVTAVGDPYQAIYGWRGASPSNILQFRTDFTNAEGDPAALYRLSVNRRSDRTIIDLANLLAEPLQSDEKMTKAFAESAVDGAQLELVAAAGKGAGAVQVATFDSWPNEVDWLADEVVAAHDRAEVERWSDVAVLVRRNADIRLIYDALLARDVPVEIVGLDGLLNLPGIIDVVDTLRLIDDVTVNPSLVNLLSGPRWRIGARDLAVLGRHAISRSGVKTQPADLDAALWAIASGADPSETPCLFDALADLPLAGLSAAAAQRCSAFRAELDKLRAHRDEPVMDLVGRVARTIGVAAQLLSWPHGEQQLRQLHRFFDQVADFADRDGDANLSGLLAWFDAELKYGVGLEQAVVSAEDSVKVLTVHRAKGLEYDLVFLPAVVAGTFPRVQVNDDWVSTAQAVPAELRGDSEWVPQLVAATKQDMDAHAAALKVEAKLSEDRLAYVAATRARHRLVVSAHHWKPGAVRELAPSEYHRKAELIAGDEGVLHRVPLPVAKPDSRIDEPVAWPVPIDEQWQEDQRWVADQVRDQLAGDPAIALESQISLDDRRLVELWRAQAEVLLVEARERADRHPNSELPAGMSASMALQAIRRPEAFAREQLRPMPAQINQVASVGSRFHRWLEQRFGLQGGFDELLETPTTQLAESVVDQQLARLCRAFEAGQFADRTPLVVEQDFVLVLPAPEQFGQQDRRSSEKTTELQTAGRLHDPEPTLIRGRIDAVFQQGQRFLVVDWKTSDRPADPLQLAIYRLAWAQIVGVEPQQVDAVFYHVASDQVERPKRLPSADELWQLLHAASDQALLADQRGAAGG